MSSTDLSPSAFFRSRSRWDRSDPETKEGLVQQLLHARSIRGDHLPGKLFSDPAWDMLLHLFAARLGRRTLSEAALFSLSGLSAGTGERWLIAFDAERLVRRFGGGVAEAQPCVALSEEGRRSMDDYFRTMMR